MVSRKQKHLTDFPNRYKRVKFWMTHYSHFSISPHLCMLKRCICKTILDPLIPAARQILVYDLNPAHKRIQKLSDHFYLKNNRHRLEMAGKSWQYFMPLLYKSGLFSTIHDVRGSILIECLNEQMPWETMFKKCSGPFVISNAGVGCGRTALKYAKRHFDDQTVFVIIERINRGLDSFTIAGIQTILQPVFDMASDICKLPVSSRYEFKVADVKKMD